MKFFRGLFKSQYQKDCELVFDCLEKIGYTKCYNNYGKEQSLVYSKGEIQVHISWESKTANPWIIVTHSGQSITPNIASIVKVEYPDIPNNPAQFDYFLSYKLPREKFLQYMYDEVYNYVSSSQAKSLSSSLDT